MGLYGGDTNATTSTVSKFEPPSYTTMNADGSSPLGPGTTWQEYLQRAGQIAGIYGTDPSLIYGNSPNQPMVAQMSDLQNKAAQGIYGMVNQGSPNDALSSGYLASMMNGSQQNQQPLNPYMGDSPAFQQMLDAQNNDITQAFRNGTAAQTDAAMAQQGAYGGSGYQQQQAMNAQGLAKALAENEATQRNAQYNQSAALAENAINRASAAYDNSANRGLQAAGLQQGADSQYMQMLQALMGAGDLQQQTQQNNINAAQQLFGQNVQQPLQALDIFGSALSRASGQGGTTTASMFGPQQSGLMNAVGAGTALYGLLGN